MYCNLGKRQVVGICMVVGLALVILGVSLGLVLYKDKAQNFTAGIVTNGHECAGIGRDILKKGGSVADAGVAALLCEGVAMPQSTGLGGGFFMTIYIKDKGIVETLNAREVAPLAATQDMYRANTTLSTIGGLSVAVPGEARGYEYIHKKYGKLPWKDILQPTIDLCKKGHLVTPFLANLFKSQKEVLKSDESLREVFIDPATGEPYKEGQRVKRPKLALTLEAIAKDGADALYRGSLTKQFVQDIQGFGGIITEEDMNKYKPQWLPPIKSELPEGQKLYTFPPPGSGIIMSFILNILEGFLDTSNIANPVNWQRIVESFKFGYGKRTLLGDPDFVNDIHELVSNFTSDIYINDTRKKISDTTTSQDPKFYGANTTTPEDHGTAHVSIIAPNGDAIALTGTINLIFGSQRRSRSTGIILNDEMDDFSSKSENYFGLPSSSANFIEAGKRPLSSMCPSIITDKDGRVLLVVGAAGGSKITTSTSLVTMRHLWLNQTLKAAIEAPRLHHQLFPMRITFESNFDKNIITALKKIGHEYNILNPADGFAAVTGVSKVGNTVEAVFDPRRPGSAIVF